MILRINGSSWKLIVKSSSLQQISRYVQYLRAKNKDVKSSPRLLTIFFLCYKWFWKRERNMTTKRLQWLLKRRSSDEIFPVNDGCLLFNRCENLPNAPFHKTMVSVTHVCFSLTFMQRIQTCPHTVTPMVLFTATPVNVTGDPRVKPSMFEKIEVRTR